ncbi:hypothetical protein BHE74_00021395 [Ensete ventricosum]|nr:hypothetical protein GW17_00002319 [Ensete ventricosum]RWW70903.1 hypothetical protein BHE74_00021395 [Ensete ventricosum]
MEERSGRWTSCPNIVNTGEVIGGIANSGMFTEMSGKSGISGSDTPADDASLALVSSGSEVANAVKSTPGGRSERFGRPAGSDVPANADRSGVPDEFVDTEVAIDDLSTPSTAGSDRRRAAWQVLALAVAITSRIAKRRPFQGFIVVSKRSRRLPRMISSLHWRP